MLVLRRKDGHWVEVTHKSGDILRIRVYNIHTGDGETAISSPASPFPKGRPGRVNLAFDDPERNFEIQRPERLVKTQRAPMLLES